MEMSENMDFFIGVDVGTGSARAALVSQWGKVERVAVQEIKTWNPQVDFYEQSSEDIWNQCIKCVKLVTKNIEVSKIKGIGFDATCSLVAIGADGCPVTVSPTGKDEQNVVLWMDHRANQEADFINNLNHPVLKYVGSKISLEMETPKLMWLKKHLETDCWNRTDLFFDLPDFLTWKATGSESRSLCSLVCKWTYEAKPDGSGSYSRSYLTRIGLEDLLQENCRKIGSRVLPPGTPVGNGLSEKAAKELGLKPGIPVGTSIIDAHAGGLGMIGCSAEGVSNEFHTRLGLICGTSTCHMAISKDSIFANGIWGPYYSAMVPGMWLNEGGQSATGKLLDHIIETHPAAKSVSQKLADTHIQKYLSDILERLAKKNKLESVDFLTRDVHVWPDFHGNRSPIADPNLKGMVSGLTLSVDEENLAVYYLAVVQALSYGTRHIVETLENFGYKDIQSILICGGLNKNPLFTQTQANVGNLPVVCPEEPESVLLGSAMLGACAAKYFKDVSTAVKSMGGCGKVVLPNETTLDYHNRKYRVFLKMVEDQQGYNKIMHSH